MNVSSLNMKDHYKRLIFYFFKQVYISVSQWFKVHFGSNVYKASKYLWKRESYKLK